jgi:Fe-S cluster biogenesis protein NfuA
VFIQTEVTPNPLTLKFLPGVEIMGVGAGILEFKSLEQASSSSVAKRILEIDGVGSVFFGSDFLSVTRVEKADWSYLTPEILYIITDHVSKDLSWIDIEVNNEIVWSDDPIERQIQEIIEYHVKPAVAQDGGDISFHSFENGIVYVTLRGACNECPSSSVTLKSGIENLLKHYIPEVKEVFAI